MSFTVFWALACQINDFFQPSGPPSIWLLAPSLVQIAAIALIPSMVERGAMLPIMTITIKRGRGGRYRNFTMTAGLFQYHVVVGQHFKSNSTERS